MNLTHEDVQEILRLLDHSAFDELHLETDRFKLTLRRSARGDWTQETRTTATPGLVGQDRPSVRESGQSTPAPAQTTAGARLDDAASKQDAIVEVCTPIVGTFYRAPKPGAAPFVEVGSRVQSDTVVGIVETMKLMNSAYAGTRGEVLEICVGDGQFVEQGQVLLRLKRTAT